MRGGVIGREKQRQESEQERAGGEEHDLGAARRSRW
jgi:hypothetical protein